MEEKLRICTFIVRMDSNLSLISKYFDYRSEIPVYSSELELWEQGNSVLKVISTESRVRTRLQLSFPPFCFKRVPSFCPLSLSVSAEGKMGSSSKEDAGTDGDTSSGDTAPANSNLFSEGERVLAYHGPRVYEAKVSVFFLCVIILLIRCRLLLHSVLCISVAHYFCLVLCSLFTWFSLFLLLLWVTVWFACYVVRIR